MSDQMLENGLLYGLEKPSSYATLEEESVKTINESLSKYPNAAKLFINWSMTKEGQTALNQFTGRGDRASLRSDVPQSKIPSDIWQRARGNGPFVDDGTKEYAKALDDSQKFLKALFAELKIAPGK